MNLTPAQCQAVSARGTSLAVSAAAGSGKTAVLTRRILNLLAEGSVDAAKLVVVTFTKAAAKELEERLQKGLSEEIENAAGEKKRALSGQLMRLSLSQISTIHSFAFSLVKEYRRNLGLGERIRIADPTESTLLLKKCVESTLSDYFSREEKKEEAAVLFDLFGSARSIAGLSEAVTELITACASYPGGLCKVEECLAERKEELTSLEKGESKLIDTRFGAVLIRQVMNQVNKSVLLLEEAKKAAESFSFGEKYLPFFEEASLDLKKSLDFLKEDRLTSAAESIKLAFSRRFPTVRKLEGEEILMKEALKDLYSDKVKKMPLRLADGVLLTTVEEIVSEGRESVAIAEALLSLAKEAKKNYSAEKREKGVVDYADLEEMCYDLFVSEGEEKNELAKEVSSRFDAIFVDEYQDTNAVQDAIFRALSREDNLFLVGDPKQSIYRFRGAAPEIFSRYKKDLPLYEEGKGGMQKILLSDNFRCDRSVIELVNDLFSCLMDENSPKSLYKEEDRLRYGKIKPEGELDHVAELVLVEETAFETEEDTGLTNEENRETAYIAGRIADLLSGQEEKAPGVPFLPSEIAVICRTHQQIAHVKKSLEARGIPSSSDSVEGILTEEEFLFVHSLLSALDNPTHDVPLLGALLSPVFRFTADELYRIRKNSRYTSFYTALSRYAEQGSHPQTKAMCVEALQCFSQLREEKNGRTLTAFLFYLYDELQIEALFAKKGKKSIVKETLFAAAAGASAAGIRTLGAFCRYLDEAEMPLPAEEGGVRLMTVHKSKGLEMPVVFVSFLGRAFSGGDERKSLILHPKLGAFVPVPRLEGRAKYDPFIRKSAKRLLKEEGLEEGMRVLYVALTRAKNKLILTAAPEKMASLSAGTLSFAQGPLPAELMPLLVADAASPLEMILLALREKKALQDVLFGEKESAEGSLLVRRAHRAPFFIWQGAEVKEEALSFDPKETLDALSFSYQKKFYETLPEKLSVSELLKAGKDEEEIEFYPRRLLDFEAGVLTTGAEQVGTATHRVMQFCDFERMAASPEKEWERLLEKGFLSEEDMALVEKDRVEAFFTSPLYQRMAKAENLVHEKRFNVFLPAATLGLGEEGEVLVQGVVDAWFENPDGTLTLLDFKTDRVKPDKGEEILLSRHEAQLRLYKKAVEALTGKTVKDLLIYSFSLGKEIVLP